MIYAGRPVFEWPIDWSREPNGSYEYDLRELQIGFGREDFSPTQDHVVQGFAFEIDLRGAELAAVEAFFTDRAGKLKTWWLPSPQRLCIVAAGVNASTFDISAQGLTESWEDHPSAHVYLSKSGQTGQAAAIIDVSDNGDGTERVTLDTNLATPVDATWHVNRLHIVRLVDDSEVSDVLAEGWERHNLQVVEVPEQYSDTFTDDTRRSAFLYHFWTVIDGQTFDWRYTSHDADVESDGETFSAIAINHSAITRTMKGDRHDVTLTTVAGAAEPIDLITSRKLSTTVEVSIAEIDWEDPDNETVLFAGRVLTPQIRGRQRTVKCAAWLDVMDQDVPAFLVQTRCNHQVYNEHCQADRDAFKKAAAIALINGRQVTIAGAELDDLAENWFAEGWLTTGTGLQYEVRTIVSSTAESLLAVTLTLNRPLSFAIVDQAVEATPGCDGVDGTCVNKFANLVNFGGHKTPLRNLTLQAITINPSGGGKK